MNHNFQSQPSEGRMKPILTIAVLGAASALCVPAHAAPKADGRPDGGVLNYSEYGRTATLDPITSNETISLRITELVFSGLVGIDEKQEIVPELAERWEASKDGRVYTFFLRKDVKWHPREGEEPRPFTADDVVFTYNIMMHPKTITPLKVRYEFIAKPFADQNIMAQALMFNAVDMIVLVNPRNLPEVQGDKRFVLQPYNALSYSFFGYNVRNPLLADRRVREAIALAVNRQEMLDSFFNGQGTVISGPFAPGSWAYNLDVKPLPFSPERSRALLAEAGFKPGADGIMEKGGQKLALSLKVPIEKESEAVKRVVLAFQNYLKSVGVAIKVEFKEWQAWKEDVFLEHNFDIMFASWVFDDSADISSLFHSAEIGDWKNNFGGYSNPEVDGLIVESKLTLDHEKRRTINRKLHAILAGAALHFPLDAHQLQRVPQEGAARADPPVQVLLVRRRVVHSRQRAEVTAVTASS